MLVAGSGLPNERHLLKQCIANTVHTGGNPSLLFFKSSVSIN